MNEQTIRCSICGQSYTFCPLKYGDQTACPVCVWKAKGREWGKVDEEWVKEKATELYNYSYYETFSLDQVKDFLRSFIEEIRGK